MKIKYNLFFSTLLMMCIAVFGTTDVFAALTLPTISVKNSNTKTKASVKSVVCNEGYYLPKNSSSCKSCSSLGEKYYCPGGSFISGPSDFGINECKNGLVANTTHTECVTKKATKTNTSTNTSVPVNSTTSTTFSNPKSQPVVTQKTEPVVTPKVVQPAQLATAKCGAGQYLPANSSSCTTCKDRYYVCIGGTFPVKNTNDQGIKKCDSGLVADEFKTQCIKQESTQNQPSKISGKCTIGQYLPKNSTTCKSCDSLSSRYYCPENTTFSNAPYTDDKGLQLCSPWQTSNSERTSCVYITQKCDPGKYLKRSINGVSCESCPSDSRYYCPGGMISSTLPDAGLKTCPSAKVANKEHSACVYKSVKIEPGQYLPKNTLSPINCSDDIHYYCPGGTFTSGPSDSGLLKCKAGMLADEHHKTCITEEKPIKTEKCNPGDYLPKNTATCKSCSSKRYYVCTGGDFPINATKDQGLTKCDSGKIPNDNHTVCIDEPPTEVYCAPGTYLPRNGKTEKDCASAKCLSAKYYFCPGGTYTVSPFDQGLDLCDDDQQANEEHTACNNLDPAMIHVPSGYYLPANSERPEECPSGANKYCVGGGFFKSGMVQGMKDCPMNTKTNEKKDGCMMSFSAEQMKRNKTNDECWLKKTSEEYKKCVFGK